MEELIKEIEKSIADSLGICINNLYIDRDDYLNNRMDSRHKEIVIYKDSISEAAKNVIQAIKEAGFVIVKKDAVEVLGDDESFKEGDLCKYEYELERCGEQYGLFENIKIYENDITEIVQRNGKPAIKQSEVI